MSYSLHESHLATARSFNVAKSASSCSFGAGVRVPLSADANLFEYGGVCDELSPLGSPLMESSWTSAQSHDAQDDPPLVGDVCESYCHQPPLNNGQYAQCRLTDADSQFSVFSREMAHTTPLTAMHMSVSEPVSLQVAPALSPPAQQMHVLQLAAGNGSPHTPYTDTPALARQESIDVPVQHSQSAHSSSRVSVSSASGQQQMHIRTDSNSSAASSSLASLRGSYATPPPARAYPQQQQQQLISPNTAAYAQQLRTTAQPVVAQLAAFSQARVGSSQSINGQHSNGTYPLLIRYTRISNS